MTKDELKTWFYEKLFSCYPVKNDEYPNSIFWYYDDKFIRKYKISKVGNKEIKLPKKVNGICLFETDIENKFLYCDYSEIWTFIGYNYNITYDYLSIQYIITDFLSDFSTMTLEYVKYSCLNILNDNLMKIYTPKANTMFLTKTNIYNNLKIYN